MTDQRDPVLVYVRLLAGDQECRELGFQIPEGISQKELLDAGFAIDGNSALKSAVPFRNGQEHIPLSQTLRSIQTHLVEFMGERGYEVVFK